MLQSAASDHPVLSSRSLLDVPYPSASEVLMALTVLAVLWLLQPAGAGRVREIAYARVPLAERIAADAPLVAAVVAKNGSGETDDDVQRRDREWTSSPKGGLRQSLTQGPCADRLRELVKGDSFVVEAFLTDGRGALVCASRETSDYWQGDEAKWQKTYGEGKRLYVDEAAQDVSTGVYAIQLSVLVSNGAAKAGALTLTLRIPASAAR